MGKNVIGMAASSIAGTILIVLRYPLWLWLAVGVGGLILFLFYPRRESR